MQVAKVTEFMNGYKDHLRDPDNLEMTFTWEAQRHFQDNWNLEAEELAIMYDNCLQNSQSRRLWKGRDFFPKQSMIYLMEVDPEFVVLMFRDLFNEQKEVGGRIGRFVHGCEVLLKQYQQQFPKKRLFNHYHEHNHIISMYLAFRYPTQYGLYFADPFQKMMQALKMPNPPSPFDYERIFKIMRTLYKLLSKDEELMELHLARLNPDRDYTPESLLLVHDFYMTCVRSLKVK